MILRAGLRDNPREHRWDDSPHRNKANGPISGLYSENLIDGWSFGTNNSADETNSWLKRACELCGV